MNLATLIAIVILVIVVFLAIRYIVRAKKRGDKCIGCPYAGSCGSADFSGSGCCSAYAELSKMVDNGASDEGEPEGQTEEKTSSCTR